MQAFLPFTILLSLLTQFLWIFLLLSIIKNWGLYNFSRLKEYLQLVCMSSLLAVKLKLDKIETSLPTPRVPVNANNHDKRILYCIGRKMGDGTFRSIIGAPRTPEYVKAKLMRYWRRETTSHSRSIPTWLALHDNQMGGHSLTGNLLWPQKIRAFNKWLSSLVCKSPFKTWLKSSAR